MASNPYVNKVVYGNQTLLDLTDDTVAPEVLLQGYKAHDKSGIEIFGSYTPITPEIITPSNSSPVSLVADHVYKPSDSGYAIASYSNITPSASGTYFSSGFKKMSSSGYVYSARPTQINMGVPDIISSANLSASASRTITVTQMPKYIVYYLDRYTYTDGRATCCIVDITNNCYAVSLYSADGYGTGKNYSGLPEALTSVTSSSVTIKNNFVQAVRSHVFIYY